jgi:hypothetical protein
MSGHPHPISNRSTQTRKTKLDVSGVPTTPRTYSQEITRLTRSSTMPSWISCISTAYPQDTRRPANWYDGRPHGDALVPGRPQAHGPATSSLVQYHHLCKIGNRRCSGHRRPSIQRSSYLDCIILAAMADKSCNPSLRLLSWLVHAKNTWHHTAQICLPPSRFLHWSRRQKRRYSQREHAIMFLQGLLKESDYVSAIQKLLQDLAQIPLEITELSNQFQLPVLPMTLLIHPVTLQPTSHAATINVIRATFRRPVDNSSNHSTPLSRGDISRGRRSHERDDSRKRSRSTSAASYTSKQQCSPRKDDQQYWTYNVTTVQCMDTMYRHVNGYQEYQQFWII